MEYQDKSHAPRPLEEWHEDLGNCLWWKFPIDEPPYVGSPLDCGQAVAVTVSYYRDGEVKEDTKTHYVGGWPGYHTHFTPIPIPPNPGEK